MSFCQKLQILGLVLLSASGCTGRSTTGRSPELALTYQPEEVKFSSGKLSLHGFIHKPEGNGPFPAILLNHGGEKFPKSGDIIAKNFVSKGYVVFFPHRRGQGRSSDQGEYIVDVISREAENTRGKKLVELQERHQEDAIAGLSYLKSLPYVDKSKIAMVGCSFGGIQTVLASEKKLGLRAAIAFAPAAMTWAHFPELRSRLIESVRSANIPILLIQARNDYDLSATQTMATELEKARKPHKRVIFPAFGKTQGDGHGFCVQGASIWEKEVFSFLESAML